MSESVWEVLGIAETPDERAIKRAYAAKLKVTSPEHDAAGFMKLREAYDAAKSHAAWLRYVAAQPPEDRAADAADPRDIEERVESAGADAADHPQSATGLSSPSVDKVTPPASPQERAFNELQELLSAGQLEAFLEKVRAVKAAEIFSTLDEQQGFVGVVAILVQQAGVNDRDWLGRLAEALGAREHDNIFPSETPYWYAYGMLLSCHAERRASMASAHAAGLDELQATPGYLHVYHVLTAPFDSERLSALTRSKPYHRIAESLLARARHDPTLSIPAENREWWERTAMAGQHRPIEEPLSEAYRPQATTNDSPAFPGWMIWIVLMVCLQGVRMCMDHTSKSPEWNDLTPPRHLDGSTKRFDPLRDPLIFNDPVFARLAHCDPQTRRALISRFYVVRADRRWGPERDPQQAPSSYESDPVVASLLLKCTPPPAPDQRPQAQDSTPGP
jgi:hypothetical protein